MNSLTRNGTKVKPAEVQVRRLPPSHGDTTGSPPGAQSCASWLWGIHWLTFTVWDEPRDVIRKLGEAFPVLRETYEPGYGGHGYRRLAIFQHGVRAWFEPVDGDTRITISFTGAFLEGIDRRALFQFLRELRDKARVQITRLDIAFDNVPFTPEDAMEAFLAGHVRTVAHRDSWKWCENADGRTFTIGDRSSPRYLRVYDARGTTRLEMEVKGEKADALFWLLVDEEDPARLSLEYVRGYVDFCKPNGANRSRWPLLDWWASFVNGVGKVRVIIPLVEKTIERVRAWLMRQVSPSLTFVSLLDPSFLHDLLEIGEGRLGPWYRLILKQAGYA